MSQALRTAIVSRIAIDTSLTALLAKDPADGTSPAVFNVNKNQAPPVYPCLTYRIEMANPDKRFRPVPAGSGPSTIEDYYLDFEGWSQADDSADCDTMLARLDALLENATFALADGSNVFRSERISAKPDLYDNKLNAWYLLARYRFRVSLPG
jgi:hypothetical protein